MRMQGSHGDFEEKDTDRLLRQIEIVSGLVDKVLPLVPIHVDPKEVILFIVNNDFEYYDKNKTTLMKEMRDELFSN